MPADRSGLHQRLHRPLHEFVTQEVHLAEHAFAIHHPDIAAKAASQSVELAD